MLSDKDDINLMQQIADSARSAFLELFSTGESFYYCVLITTGEALPPTLSAWSRESLKKYSDENNIDEDEIIDIKWSYADSPYLGFGNKHFEKVKALFSSRIQLDETTPNHVWDCEYSKRLTAMEDAMSQLDAEGIFSVTQDRDDIFINVEVVPPDRENTLRALRLNSDQAIKEWLTEIGSP